MLGELFIAEAMFSNPEYIGQQKDLFLAVAKHTEECEDIVQAICNGETCVDVDDYFDESDLEYISKRCAEYGLDVNLTLS